MNQSIGFAEFMLLAGLFGAVTTYLACAIRSAMKMMPDAVPYFVGTLGFAWMAIIGLGMHMAGIVW